jgi:hypothetical protein
LRILDGDEGEEGARALIATLSAYPQTVAPHLNIATSSKCAVLPVEMTERIFKYLAVRHPSAIPRFASTCKQFAAIVSENVLRFPGCTLFPHAKRLGGNPTGDWATNLFRCVSGVDHKTHKQGVFYVAGEEGDCFYRLVRYEHHYRERDTGPRRDYEVLENGANFGLFGLNLSLCEYDEKAEGYVTIETERKWS